MGNFYTNVTLGTADQTRVVEALKSSKRQALVSPPANNCIVVFDRESEEQDIRVLNELASALSKRLGCPALAVLNHDDDILCYTLYERGQMVDEYDSAPEYFTDGPRADPEGGDAERLCRAFVADGKTDEVENVLRAPKGQDGFIFELERHEALVSALGLPAAAVATGYNYLEQGEFPAGLSSSDFVRVG